MKLVCFKSTEDWFCSKTGLDMKFFSHKFCFGSDTFFPLIEHLKISSDGFFINPQVNTQTKFYRFAEGVEA